MANDKRRDKRSRVFLSATLHSAHGEANVRLSDLSTLGACADRPSGLQPGDEIHVCRGDLSVAARIVWARGSFIGIEFAKPLNLDQFRGQGQRSSKFELAAMHRPVEKLTPRLERHWAQILSR